MKTVGRRIAEANKSLHEIFGLPIHIETTRAKEGLTVLARVTLPSEKTWEDYDKETAEGLSSLRVLFSEAYCIVIEQDLMLGYSFG
jgi:hypothetical protein